MYVCIHIYIYTIKTSNRKLLGRDDGGAAARGVRGPPQPLHRLCGRGCCPSLSFAPSCSLSLSRARTLSLSLSLSFTRSISRSL